MARFRRERVIPIIFVTVIIVIAVIAIISLGRVIFSGITGQPTITDTSRQTLTSTSIGHSVQMKVRGPIVANEELRSYRIDVSPESRSMTTFSGYNEQKVIDNRQLGNTAAAYADFVNALDRANLASGKQLEGDSDNRLGVCASGSLYEFAIIKDDEPVKDLWTSTCRNASGSLRANVKVLRDLFVRQIPDGTSLVKKIRL